MEKLSEKNQNQDPKFQQQQQNQDQQNEMKNQKIKPTNENAFKKKKENGQKLRQPNVFAPQKNLNKNQEEKEEQKQDEQDKDKESKEQEEEKSEDSQIQNKFKNNHQQNQNGPQFLKRFTIKSLRQKLKKIRMNDDYDEQFIKETLLQKEGLLALKNMSTFPSDDEVQLIKHLCSYYLSKYNQIVSLAITNQQIKNFEIQKPSPVKQIENELVPSIQWEKFPKYIIPDLINYTLYYQIKKRDWFQVAQKLKFLKRKRRQLEFFVVLLQDIIEKRKQSGRPVKRIVDFAGGRGDLTLLIGYLFPDINITVIDIKKETLLLAKYRVAQMGMKNVSTVLGDIRQFKEEFDIAIGIHACGGLTDIVLQQCQEQKNIPSILICTCCFAKIKGFMKNITYPKSFDNIQQDQYLAIADYAETDSIVKIVNGFRNATKEFQIDLSQHEVYKHLSLNLDLCQEQIDLDSIQQLPAYCRQYINHDRLASFNNFIDQKMGKDYNIRPYILEIPSEYTLRNQFLVLP